VADGVDGERLVERSSNARRTCAASWPRPWVTVAPLRRVARSTITGERIDAHDMVRVPHGGGQRDTVAAADLENAIVRLQVESPTAHGLSCTFEDRWAMTNG
jgi:hypothetical protein